MDDRGRGGPPWVLPLVSPVFGAALGSSRRPNPAEMRVFYGFTDFRGKLARRGGGDAEHRIKLPPGGPGDWGLVFSGRFRR